MNHGSLFSGIGGIDLAAHWVGMQTIVFCEREPFPQSVLRKHWPDVPIINDVHDFTREELERDGVIGPDRAIDIISAGYPCQPFSFAGKRGGEKDDRHLWPEVKRVLSEIRPRWFVGENVVGHITLGLSTVIADLEALGYDFPRINGRPVVFRIPASAVGASHQRNRVFIVAYTDRPERRADRSSSGRVAGPDAVQEWSESASGLAKCCSAMADTACELPHGIGREGRRRDEHPNGCRDVAHPNGAGREERDTATVASGEGYCSGGGNAGTMADPNIRKGDERRGRSQADDARCGRRRMACSRRDGSDVIYDKGKTTKPGMGRNPDELSGWLDGGINPLDALAEFIATYPQPALMGQEQFGWEPPRVATGVKDRTARLKALGNAVDPLQILPIMYAIKMIDGLIKREGEVKQ